MPGRPRNSLGQYEPGPKRSAVLSVRCSQADVMRWQAATEDTAWTLSHLVRFLLDQWVEHQRMDTGE